MLGRFVDEAELTIWDGMFTETELGKFFGWGHSSVEQGAVFLDQSNCKQLAITHHAPKRTDDQLEKIKKSIKNSNVVLAHENQSIQL